MCGKYSNKFPFSQEYTIFFALGVRKKANFTVSRLYYTKLNKYFMWLKTWCKGSGFSRNLQYLKYGILGEHETEGLINLNDKHIEKQPRRPLTDTLQHDIIDGRDILKAA